MSVKITIGQTALGGVGQSVLVLPDGSAGAGAGGHGVGEGGEDCQLQRCTSISAEAFQLDGG